MRGLHHCPFGFRMYESSVEQLSHYCRYSSNTIEISHEIEASGTEVSDLRCPLAYQGEVIKCQPHPLLGSNCQQVQYHVCGSTQRARNCDGILEGLLG